MAKKIPPRPGGVPPRPGARPRPGAPARPAAPPRPEADRDLRPSTRPGDTETPVERSVVPPAAPDALEMVPLGDTGPAQDQEPAPSTATTFFALPQPKRKKPEEPPPAPEPPPPPPPPAASAPNPAGLGIQGPVASGPVAGAPTVSGPVAQGPITGPVASGPVAQGPVAGGAPPTQRARSYRVFAFVTGLMFLVFTAALIAVGLVAWGVWSAEETPDQPVASISPALQAAPAPAVRVEDTAAPPEPPKPPEPAKRPAQASSSPKPAPRPTGPAPATIQIPADQPFTSIEVTCPSGFRARAPFEGGRATVRDVPREDCTVHFKGGPPARNRISGGQTKTCTFPNAQAVCK